MATSGNPVLRRQTTNTSLDNTSQPSVKYCADKVCGEGHPR